MGLAYTLAQRTVTMLPRRRQFQFQLHMIDRWRSFEFGYHLMAGFITSDKIAIDVGANEGFYAGKMAQYARHVHCFEPIPHMAADLAKKMPKNVTVHPVAASNQKGTAKLRIPYKDGIEQHGTTTIEEGNTLNEADSFIEHQIETCRLDDVIGTGVGVLKIDVEGHEISVLQGAERILTKDRPVVLVESEHRHNQKAPEGCIELLESVGYIGTTLQNKKIHNLKGFTKEKHQKVEDIQEDRHGAYCNNFLFFPPLD